MSFYLKYELSRLLHADGAKTFQAIEKATRRNVLLHLVDKTASPELIGKVKRLETGQDRELIEVGEFAGSYFVVTDAIEGFPGLDAWLDQRMSGAAKPRSPDPAPDGPGEFTAFFGKAAEAPVPTNPTLKPITSPTIVDPQPSRLDDDEPGEFTKLFGGGATGKPPPRQATLDHGPPPSRPTLDLGSPPVRGEPNRRFGEAPPPRQTPPPPAAQAPNDSGEFTRMFGGTIAPPSAPRTPAPQPAADAGNASSGAKPIQDDSGEFTKLFGGAAKADSPAASGAGVSEESGEFTRLFGGATEKADEPAVRLTPAPSSKGGDIQKSSGEFTRLFGPSGKGAPGPKKPASGPAPKLIPEPLEGSLGSSSGAPGDFTLMFGGRSARQPSGYGDGAPAAPRPPAASFGEGLVGEISGDEALAPDKGPKVSKSSKPFQAPGEFTRMFGPSDPTQRPPEDFIPAARSGGSEAYASGLFRNPHAEPRQPAGGAPLSSGAGGAAQQAAGPGDYTMHFERSAAGTAPAVPAAQAQPPQAAIQAAAPAGSKTSKTMLIALVAAVLVAGLSLGAAVYLFFNRAADDAGGEKPPAIEQPAQPEAQ